MTLEAATQNSGSQSDSTSGALLQNWQTVSRYHTLKNLSDARRKMLDSYNYYLDKRVDMTLKAPAPANQNSQHHVLPDWSVLSLKKLHKNLGKAQHFMTAIGLVIGLVYAWMSVAGIAAPSASQIVFSFLTFGMIGAAGGYLAIWGAAAFVMISPALLIMALIL